MPACTLENSNNGSPSIASALGALTPATVDPLQHAVTTTAAAAAARSASGEHANGGGVVTIRDAIEALHANASLIAAAEEHLQQLLAKQQALMLAERLLEQDRVAALLADRPLGFHRGRPVAALVLARCLLHWGVLTAPGAPLDDDAAALLRRFSSLLQQQLQAACDDDAAAAAAAHTGAGTGWGDASPPHPDGAGAAAAPGRATAAYWLSVASALLALVVRARRRAGAGGAAASDADARSQAMRRGIQQLQRRLADGVGELHLGARLGEGLHQLWARRPGKQAPGWGEGGVAGAAEGEAGGMHEPTPSLASTSSTASSFLGSAPPQEPAPAPAPPQPLGAAAAAAAGPVGPAVADPLAEFAVSLDSIVQAAFVAVRDQLRRRLLPLLANCMQHAAGEGGGDGGDGGGGEDVRSEGEGEGEGDGEGGLLSAAAQESLLEAYRDWAEMVAALSGAVDALQAECVPAALVRAVLQQALGFVNAQLFNQLLLRTELCCTANARYALRGLKQVDGLLLQLGEGQLGKAGWAALDHTRQALQFLALERKGELSHDDIARELCPALTQQQLYRLCTTSWDDTPGAESARVSGEVLEEMHAAHAAAAGAPGSTLAGLALGGDKGPALTNQGLVVTCLLDEPGPPPFTTPADGAAGAGAGRSSTEAVLSWLEGRDWSQGVPVPQQLLEGCPAEVFAFLQEPTPSF